jgi:hypothetical protein
MSGVSIWLTMVWVSATTPASDIFPVKVAPQVAPILVDFLSGK